MALDKFYANHTSTDALKMSLSVWYQNTPPRRKKSGKNWTASDNLLGSVGLFRKFREVWGSVGKCGVVLEVLDSVGMCATM